MRDSVSPFSDLHLSIDTDIDQNRHEPYHQVMNYLQYKCSHITIAKHIFRLGPVGTELVNVCLAYLQIAKNTRF